MSNLEYSMGSAYYNGLAHFYTSEPAKNKPNSQESNPNNSINSKKTYGYTATKPRNDKSYQLDEYDYYYTNNSNDDYDDYVEYLNNCESNKDNNKNNNILKNKYESINKNNSNLQTNKKIYGVGKSIGLNTNPNQTDLKKNISTNSNNNINFNQSNLSYGFGSSFNSSSSNTSNSSNSTNNLTKLSNTSNNIKTVKVDSKITYTREPISAYLIKPEYFKSEQQLQNRYYGYGVLEKTKETIKEINKRLEQNNCCDNETKALVSEIYSKLDLSCYHYTNKEKLEPCLKKIEKLHQNYLNKLEDLNSNIKQIEVINYPKTSVSNPFHIDISLLYDKSQLKLEYESIKYYNEIIQDLIKINNFCEKKERVNCWLRLTISLLTNKIDENNPNNNELLNKLKAIF